MAQLDEHQLRLIQAFLTGASEAASQFKVLLEHGDTPVGVTDAGELAVPGLMLAMGTVANSDAVESIDEHLAYAMNALAQDHGPEEVQLILYAALLNLTNLYLRPTLDQLTTDGVDVRETARSMWAAVTAASAKDWEDAAGGEC